MGVYQQAIHVVGAAHLATGIRSPIVKSKKLTSVSNIHIYHIRKVDEARKYFSRFDYIAVTGESS